METQRASHEDQGGEMRQKDLTPIGDAIVAVLFGGACVFLLWLLATLLIQKGVI